MIFFNPFFYFFLFFLFTRMLEWQTFNTEKLTIFWALHVKDIINWKNNNTTWYIAVWFAQKQQHWEVIISHYVRERWARMYHCYLLKCNVLLYNAFFNIYFYCSVVIYIKYSYNENICHIICWVNFVIFVIIVFVFVLVIYIYKACLWYLLNCFAI